MKSLFDALPLVLKYDPSPLYIPGTLLPLVSYRDPAKEPEERGRAVLNVTDGAFRVSTVLEDTDIYNTATQNNDKTWLTGDVLEFFIRAVGHKDYYEFHVTPDQITLQLHISSPEELSLFEHEEKTCDVGITGKANMDRKNNLWTAELIVPFASIGVTENELDGIQFAICRYNYNRKWQEPEISSTRFFPQGGFHCPSEWHTLSYQK